MVILTALCELYWCMIECQIALLDASADLNLNQSELSLKCLALVVLEGEGQEQASSPLVMQVHELEYLCAFELPESFCILLQCLCSQVQLVGTHFFEVPLSASLGPELFEPVVFKRYSQVLRPLKLETQGFQCRLIKPSHELRGLLAFMTLLQGESLPILEEGWCITLVSERLSEHQLDCLEHLGLRLWPCPASDLTSKSGKSGLPDFLTADFYLE